MRKRGCNEGKGLSDLETRRVNIALMKLLSRVAFIEHEAYLINFQFHDRRTPQTHTTINQRWLSMTTDAGFLNKYNSN